MIERVTENEIEGVLLASELLLDVCMSWPNDDRLRPLVEAAVGVAGVLASEVVRDDAHATRPDGFMYPDLVEAILDVAFDPRLEALDPITGGVTCDATCACG